MKGQGPNIIGRDSITALKLKWSSVHQLKDLDLAAVVGKHSEVFFLYMKNLLATILKKIKKLYTLFTPVIIVF